MIKIGDNTFTAFLSLLKVNYTKRYANKCANEHPHKYNLLGLSKLLSDYGIRNAATRIKDKEQDLLSIETPFIARLGNDFVVVEKIEKNMVSYLWNGKKITISKYSFLKVWDGIILLAETSPESIEPDYTEHRKQVLLSLGQKILLLIAIGLILFLIYAHNALFQNLRLNSLIFINLTGVYICYLLILKQMNIQSKYTDKICSLFSQSDCNSVLESDAAKLFGVLGWSEIGLGYFVANTLIIIIFPQFVSFIALINIFTLPYSIWSVWYQKVKAKQWCPLCLIVQALLWGILILNLFFGFIQTPPLNWETEAIFVFISCIYSAIIFIFNLFIPKLSTGQQLEELKQEINSLKANEEVFISLLKQQPKYEVTKNDSQILMGKSESKLMITILTNPFCNPCAKMHKRIDQFLKDTKNDICIQYILSSFSKELDYANQYLIAAYLQKGLKIDCNIFDEWFEKGRLLKKAFFKDMSLDLSLLDVEAEFQKHKAWKEKSQLTATPTILINGYQLPQNYKIEDLKYFTQLKIDIN